jgi:AraC-like DNA-binding protein
MQVSMMMVRALAGEIERQGARRDRFLEQAGIDASAFEDANARVSIIDYLRALDAALEVSNDPALGIHMGEHASPVMFDVIGHLVAHAANMRESIQTTSRYARLAADGHDPLLVESEATAFYKLPSLRGNLPAVRLTAEFALTGFLILLRMYSGPSARPNFVSFAYDAPPYAAEYERVFGCPVQFGAEDTSLEFPRAWLDNTHAYRSPDLHALLETQAERMLGRLERKAVLTERVMQLLASHDPRALPTMDEVARTLHTSSRSLRRKLATEGAAFGELVERTLMNAAKRMLEDPRASIQETAYAMGFAAPAAFHRAFRRWTGLTPKQYKASF